MAERGLDDGQVWVSLDGHSHEGDWVEYWRGTVLGRVSRVEETSPSSHSGLCTGIDMWHMGAVVVCHVVLLTLHQLCPLELFYVSACTLCTSGKPLLRFYYPCNLVKLSIWQLHNHNNLEPLILHQEEGHRWRRHQPLHLLSCISFSHTLLLHSRCCSLAFTVGPVAVSLMAVSLLHMLSPSVIHALAVPLACILALSLVTLALSHTSFRSLTQSLLLSLSNMLLPSVLSLLLPSHMLSLTYSVTLALVCSCCSLWLLLLPLLSCSPCCTLSHSSLVTSQSSSCSPAGDVTHCVLPILTIMFPSHIHFLFT